MTTPDNVWFNNAIVDGLQMLVVLALPNAPLAETVHLTAEVWIDTLWQCRRWDAQCDGQRLHAAFAALAVSLRRWPAPRSLLDVLPPPPEPIRISPPPASLAQRAHALDRLAAARATLLEALAVPKPGRERDRSQARATGRSAGADDEQLLASARGWFSALQLPAQPASQVRTTPRRKGKT